MTVDLAMAVSPHDTRWHGARTAMFREHARSLWAKAMGAAGALDAGRQIVSGQVRTAPGLPAAVQTHFANRRSA